MNSSSEYQLSIHKKIAFTIALAAILWLVLYGVIVTVGYALIKVIYCKLLPFPALNSLITGQNSHDVQYYHALLREKYLQWSPCAFSFYLLGVPAIRQFCRGVYALTMMPSQVVIVWLAIVSVLIMPPVLSGMGLTMGSLIGEEKRALWLWALAGIAAAFIAKRSRFKPRGWILWVAVIGLLLVSSELLVRGVVAACFRTHKEALARIVNTTYPSQQPFQPHPFLGFAGKPGFVHLGDEYFQTARLNNFGYNGPDFSYGKASNIVRIAALGGSTTADGYPLVVENELNKHLPSMGKRAEVLNFGFGFYTSAHSLVNLALNVVDFEPDYVLLHDGWNDVVARGKFHDPFRGDYSHALKSYDPEMPVSYLLIRSSVAYRLIYMAAQPVPYWTSLDAAILRKRRLSDGPYEEGSEQLKPFERNVQTIIDISRARGIKIVLVTQPYSTAASRQADKVPHIAQCNDIVRRLQRISPDVMLIDLDRIMTGKMNSVFLDVGHLNREGIEFKGKAVAAALLDAIERGE